MNSKWQRREKKKESERNRVIMHGKGMKRVENDLENRRKYKTVSVGMTFTDESKNRELKVVRKHDYLEDHWFCACTNNPIEVLYSYSETFILRNIKFAP